MEDHLTSDEEHERRFLVGDLTILDGVPFQDIQQAYLWSHAGYSVRVRLLRSPDTHEDHQAYLTLKSPASDSSGYTRYEVERPIDTFHAAKIIAEAEHVVTKHRYGVVAQGEPYDVDVFTGANEGLVIAEFEGSLKAVANLQKPWFASREITSETKYRNDQLAVNPYSAWG